MKIRDRIKELRRMKASELAPNPSNYREHPAEQRNALRAILQEVGFADAVLGRELKDGGIMLLDGHLRQELAEEDEDQEIPVLILDVNEKEADLILATHDPVGAMANINGS